MAGAGGSRGHRQRLTHALGNQDAASVARPRLCSGRVCPPQAGRPAGAQLLSALAEAPGRAGYPHLAGGPGSQAELRNSQPVSERAKGNVRSGLFQRFQAALEMAECYA